MAENFPNLVKEIEIHIQKAQLKPNNECFRNKKMIITDYYEKLYTN